MPKWLYRLPKRLVLVVGLYTVGYTVYDMCYSVVAQNIRDRVNLRQRYGPGSWVVITGATDEVGQEYARNLSKYGFNLVLIDENQEDLYRLRDTILSNGNNVDVTAVPFNFKKATSWRDYQALCNGITTLTRDKELSMLINNVE